MKWLKNEDNFEVVEFEPIQRTIQAMPLEPRRNDDGEVLLENYFLKFPYMIFARRRVYVDRNMRFSYESGDGKVFVKNQLFLGFSNEPINNLEDDYKLYCPPFVNVARDGAVCLGNGYTGQQDDYINQIINEFWSTSFERQVPRIAEGQPGADLVNIPLLNLEDWHHDQQGKDVLNFEWGENMIPISHLGKSLRTLEIMAAANPFAYAG